MNNENPVIFHLDMKVAQFQRRYLKGFFARLKCLGYTHVCIEVEDKVRLDTCPEAAWVEAYSKEDFSSLLEDAREAGLVPFPLVQTFGHLEYVLRHARFAPLREDPCRHAQICPSNPDAVRFVKNLCAEVQELFGNPPFFHLGGDETRSLGACPQCARQVATDGVSRLYVDHMRAVCEPLISAGVRPIIWADMLLAHPETIKDIPREVILCDWDYWTGDAEPHSVRVWGGNCDCLVDVSKGEVLPASFMKRYGEFLYPNGPGGEPAPWFYTDYLRAHGYDVFVAPAARCMGDSMFFPATEHFPNCTGAAVKAIAKREAAGIMVTSWAVRLNHLETQWLSIAAPALVATKGAASHAELLVAAERLGMGDGSTLWRLYEALGSTPPFSESLGSIRAEIYGMCSDLAGDIRRFFGDEKRVRDAIVIVEKQLAAYNEVERMLASLCRDSGDKFANMRHWVAALHGLRHKGQQFLALARWHRDGNPSKQALAAVEQELAAVWDETAACLADSYTVGTLHRELMMRFGAEWRLFTSAAESGHLEVF